MDIKSLFSTTIVEQIVDNHRVKHFDVYLSDTFLFSSNEYTPDREYDMRQDEYKAVDILSGWLQAGGVDIECNGHSASITVEVFDDVYGWVISIPTIDSDKHAYPITEYTLSEAILACENGEYEVTSIAPSTKRKIKQL